MSASTLKTNVNILSINIPGFSSKGWHSPGDYCLDLSIKTFLSMLYLSFKILFHKTLTLVSIVFLSTSFTVLTNRRTFLKLSP